MKGKLEITVFLSGAIVMILEITGSRVLAPYLGTSIIVWTSLIGIILGSLSLGYYLGGRLADKNPSYRNFSLIIFMAAVLIAITGLTKETVLEFLQNNITSLRANAVLATIVLFAPASIFLGMVSPYAVKLKIKSLDHSGRTVGNLYAISTIGSIVGTFLAGFYLLAWLGNHNLLIAMAIALALIALFVYSKTKIAVTIILVAYLGAVYTVGPAYSHENTLLDTDTAYGRVVIYDTTDKKGEKIRTMSLNSNHSSAMYLNSDELVFQYTKFYDLAGHFSPQIERALMIGGGAYSYPKYFLNKFPHATIDVIEIDRALTELSRKYFKLEDNSRLNIYHEDGRTFLNKTGKKYDAIFGDAFMSYSIPHQLTTVEAAQKYYDILNRNGVFIANIITHMEGDKSKFLRAEYRTLKEVFPQVYIFPVWYPENGDLLQNVMLIALKSEKTPSFKNSDPELSQFLKHRWKKEIPLDLPILTDDFAPVDQYIMKLL